MRHGAQVSRASAARVSRPSSSWARRSCTASSGRSSSGCGGSIAAAAPSGRATIAPSSATISSWTGKGRGRPLEDRSSRMLPPFTLTFTPGISPLIALRSMSPEASRRSPSLTRRTSSTSIGPALSRPISASTSCTPSSFAIMSGSRSEAPSRLASCISTAARSTDPNSIFTAGVAETSTLETAPTVASRSRSRPSATDGMTSWEARAATARVAAAAAARRRLMGGDTRHTCLS
ncbi:proteophosphoglycan 5 [Nocardioides sp. JS614]|nr:proteophosphoglycan 5 [Nocardioides sp. JS614]